MQSADANDAPASSARLIRTGVIAVACALGALALFCFAFEIAQSFVRPMDYPEGCILFNASRIRDGLPLYVDPGVGAYEYGEPPSRYYVAYVPIAAAALSLFSTKLALVIARLVGLVAWYAALGWSVYSARPGCRGPAAVAALFVGGTYLLAMWAADAKPDSIALLIASLALARSLRKGQADAWAGVLFAIALLVKPSVMGMGVGAIGGSLLVHRRRAFPGAIAALAVLFGALGLLQIGSSGRALSHLQSALGLAFVPALSVENLASRLPFIAGLVVIAGMAAFRARGTDGGRIAAASLFTSLFFMVIGFGKIGAASNYLMEPALASVVILAHHRLHWPTTLAARGAAFFLATLTLAWATTGSVLSLDDEVGKFGQERAALERIRSRCNDRPGALSLSLDPGIEMELNGRLQTHHVELWNAARAGRFSSALWAHDMQSRRIRCFVITVGKREPPPVPGGLVPADVAEVLFAEFRLVARVGTFAVYARPEE